jgi:hypothetical protein
MDFLAATHRSTSGKAAASPARRKIELTRHNRPGLAFATTWPESRVAISLGVSCLANLSTLSSHL